MSRPSAKLLADFYELVDRLSATRSLTESLDEILDASLKLIHADAGIIRLYNESEENFSVVAQRGFGSEHVALVESLAPRLFSEGPSSHAFLTKERVIVEDLTSHPFVATHREAYEESGVVALQVTPLITRTQLAIGTISTYFREARVPNAEALHLLDLYARLATDTIEREQNLSERLASEAALKQSERRFRRLYELTLRLMKTESFQGALDEVLEATIELLNADAGYVRLLGQGPHERFGAHKGFSDEFLRYFTGASEQEIEDGPTRTAMKTGHRVIFENIDRQPVFQKHAPFADGAGFRTMQATPLLDHTGNVLGAIATYASSGEAPSRTDLEVLDLYAGLAAHTIEREGVLDELARAGAELKQALKLKDDFLGMVSHELRTPMTVVRGIASVLVRTDAISADERRTAYADLSRESERLYRLIENMLTLARIEAGQRPPMEPISLSRTIEALVSEANQLLPGLNLKVQSSRDDVIVLGVEGYLKQILLNLLENAVKYSPPQSQIDVVVEPMEDEVEISVLDRGVGVKKPEALFQPFYREEKPEVRASGLGLGLAVCKTLVEIQSGSIWAEPRDERGTALRFTLPRVHDGNSSPGPPNCPRP